MSIAPATSSHHYDGRYAEPDGTAPRVRHQARDAATVMAFSAATSLGVAVVFLLLAVAARQA